MTVATVAPLLGADEAVSDMREFAPAYDSRMALISWDRWLDRHLDEPVDFGVPPAHLRFSAHAERRASLRDRRVRDLPMLGRPSRRSGVTSRRR